MVRHIEVVFRHSVNLEGLYEESESEGVFVFDMRATAQLDGTYELREDPARTTSGQKLTRGICERYSVQDSTASTHTSINTER